MSEGRTERLLDGLCFGEGPRWHEERLWFSDMHDQRVIAVGLDGRAETICEVASDPSGLGWLPDGRLLVVSMRDRRLLRREADGSLVEHADLSGLATFHCNDMLVDRTGRAYVGNFGWDLHGGGQPAPADLALVMPDGRVEVAAEALDFPNGTVLDERSGTLIVAETMGRRLTAFDVGPEGRLSNRRSWAQLEILPDGICLDAEGAIWVAAPMSHAVFRVGEGGRVLDRIALETDSFACMLGGPERRHLFVCTAADSSPARASERTGRIEVVEVEVPGAGLP